MSSGGSSTVLFMFDVLLFVFGCLVFSLSCSFIDRSFVFDFSRGGYRPLFFWDERHETCYGTGYGATSKRNESEKQPLE